MTQLQESITSKESLFRVIEQIHFDCYWLCKHAFGTYYENAGNVSVFCHSDEEYATLTKIREVLTKPSDNPNQKYFQLHDPIIFSAKGDVPETTYHYLYIRKPDPTPYGHFIGDVDFYTNDEEYRTLKQSLVNGRVFPGAEVYDRPGWDCIQLSDPTIASVGFLEPKTMTEKVRIKFD